MPESVKYLDAIRTQELIDEIKARLAAKVPMYTTMPEATAALAGTIALYTGVTNTNYTNGVFYEAVYDETDGGSWVKKSYTKDEIDALVSSAGHFAVVAELPTTDIQTNVIYLVPKVSDITGYYSGTADDPVYVTTGDDTTPAYDKYEKDTDLGIYIFSEEVTGSDAETIKGYIDAETYTTTTVSAESREANNIKTEYINLTGTAAGWEKIGDTRLDLSEYVKFENLVPITSAELAAMWED